MTHVETIDREDDEPASRKRRGGLFVTDTEIIERLNVPPKIVREAIQALDQDRKSGFPQKQKLWGDRRYWPAVQAYFDVHLGLKVSPQGRHSHER